MGLEGCPGPVVDHRVSLYVTLTDVDWRNLNRKRHARVQFDGVDLSCAISPTIAATMPRADLATWLAKEIARRLTPLLMSALEAWIGR